MNEREAKVKKIKKLIDPDLDDETLVEIFGLDQGIKSAL